MLAPMAIPILMPPKSCPHFVSPQDFGHFFMAVFLVELVVNWYGCGPLKFWMSGDSCNPSAPAIPLHQAGYYPYQAGCYPYHAGYYPCRLGTTPTRLRTTPTMLGTTPTRLGTTPGYYPYHAGCYPYQAGDYPHI